MAIRSGAVGYQGEPLSELWCDDGGFAREIWIIDYETEDILGDILIRHHGIIDFAAGDFEHFVMRSLLLSSILIFAVWINKGNRYIQM